MRPPKLRTDHPLLHIFRGSINRGSLQPSIKRVFALLNELLLRNPIREYRIRSSQVKSLRESFSTETEHLIIFLTPGYDFVNGGIMSICSLCYESQKLAWVREAAVLLCTMPTHPLLFKYTRFSNLHHLYELRSTLAYFKKCLTVMIHVPDLYVETFAQYLSTFRDDFIGRYKLHINILLQNIDHAPSIESVRLFNTYGTVSCTTAHAAYSTPDTARRIGCTVHRLSTFVSPEQFAVTTYPDKDNILIVSPDPHPSKKSILESISQLLPQLSIRVISGMTYEEFKYLISRAKWALTFGEGLDGYFIEPIFSGGIGFAVYNERFFTKDFRDLPTVYPDYESLAARICDDIHRLDSPDPYLNYHKVQYELLCSYYRYEEYLDNLKSFYLKYYCPTVTCCG